MENKVFKVDVAKAEQLKKDNKRGMEMDKQEDPFYMLEQKEKEMRDLLFSVLTENARLIEENKRLRKEKKRRKKYEIN